MSDKPYSRAIVLRALFPGHKHPMLHLDPPNFQGDLTDEYRRAVFNAALIETAIGKEQWSSPPARLEALSAAYWAERAVAKHCIDLQHLNAA